MEKGALVDNIDRETEDCRSNPRTSGRLLKYVAILLIVLYCSIQSANGNAIHNDGIENALSKDYGRFHFMARYGDLAAASDDKVLLSTKGGSPDNQDGFNKVYADKSASSHELDGFKFQKFAGQKENAIDRLEPSADVQRIKSTRALLAVRLNAYVDNKLNRRIGRVGMPIGTAVFSRGSRIADGTHAESYVDNKSNRALNRVDLPRGSLKYRRGGL